MTTELKYLALVATLNALIWMPYILNMIMVRGLVDAVGYPENPKPMAAWATRLKAAHYNGVENLVVFAALVLVAHVAGVKGEATAMASIIYFWARVVHAVAYTFAIPWIRTLAFTVGWACQLTLAYKILA
ncbi:MAG TPA: MAPEG family protein [Burkholderiales bacterium]|nr:MAPEG family protein [Burkholderiales bacterium]